MIKNKKILIVGAGGFIGGHLVKKLLNDDNNGILSWRFLVNDTVVLTSEGKISEYFGANVTSSKVSASFIGTMIFYIRFLIN